MPPTTAVQRSVQQRDLRVSSSCLHLGVRPTRDATPTPDVRRRDAAHRCDPRCSTCECSTPLNGFPLSRLLTIIHANFDLTGRVTAPYRRYTRDATSARIGRTHESAATDAQISWQLRQATSHDRVDREGDDQEDDQRCDEWRNEATTLLGRGRTPMHAPTPIAKMVCEPRGGLTPVLPLSSGLITACDIARYRSLATRPSRL